jgi:hypothetical protein
MSAEYGVTILQALESGPKLTRQLAAVCACASIRNCLGVLRRRGYIISNTGVHDITEAGRDALARNVKLGLGPCAGKATSRAGQTLRDRAWYMLRTGKIYTLENLMDLLCTGAEKTAAGNLRTWLTALTRAGYLLCVRRGYRLCKARDTGPEAPSWNTLTGIVTDVNTGERHIVRRRARTCEN